MTAPTQLPDRQLSPAELAQILALVKAQAAIRSHLTQTAVNGTKALLQGFTDWWSPAAVNQLVVRILKVVQPVQLQVARTTDAYMSSVSTLLTHSPVRPAGAININQLRRDITTQVARDLVAGRRKPAWIELGNPVDGPSRHINAPFVPQIHPDTGAVVAAPDRSRFSPAQAALRPEELATRTMPRRTQPTPWLPPAAPYERIAEQYRYQVIAGGDPEEKAAAKALVRIETVVRTDIALTVREQYHRNLNLPRGQRQEATGWRRVLHPEMSQSGPCGLCVVAADRTYKKEQLKDIHDGCVCEVLPIYGKLDPGITLNSNDLAAIYAAAGGTGKEVIGKDGRRHSAALKKLRVVLTEHGELGPVLIDASQHYRSPVDVAKTKAPDRSVRARAQLASLEKSYATLQRRYDQGENVDKPLQWQEAKINELRKELALV